MVAMQISARGIRDPLVLDAMRLVPREDFVPPSLAESAYRDRPLPIGEGQTISQPYIVAAMTAAVRPKLGDCALEIGTGSGYGAAVLSQIAAEVYTVERIGTLAASAGRRLAALGYTNVHVLEGDGTLGWPAHAPYDVIIVTAGGPRVPAALLDQLAVGGRLVMPVGPTPHLQRLVRVTRKGQDELRHEDLEAVAFVPLIGAQGWPEKRPAAGTRTADSGAREETGPERQESRLSDAEEENMTTQAFYRTVMGTSRETNLEAAKHATAAVFHALRDRLTPDEADHVVAQLPLHLKTVWDEGEKPERRPLKMNRDEFFELVRRETGLTSIREARWMTLAVFAGLKRQLSPGEAGDVLAQLPKDLKEVWVEAQPRA